MFEVKSGKIVVSDPCYHIDPTFDKAHMLEARNGEWTTSCEYEDQERRISILSARHLRGVVATEKHVASAVDSGQMSIVDANEYRRDCIAVLEGEGLTGEPWYDMCCEKTLSADGYGLLPGGVVSSTGYGDGCYDTVMGLDSDGKVVSVKITFIPEDETELCDSCCSEWDEYELRNGLCPDCQIDYEDCERCGEQFEETELDGGLCEDCRFEVDGD